METMEQLQEIGEYLNRTLEEMGVKCKLKAVNENIFNQTFDFDLMDFKNYSKIKKAAEILSNCLHKNIEQAESLSHHFALRIKKRIEKVSYFDYQELEQSNRYSALIGINYNMKPIYFDVPKATHTIIGGATGMGKTSLINNIIYSLTKKNTPKTLQMILVDTKRTMTIWNKLPHLFKKTAEDSSEAYHQLCDIVNIMEKRHEKLSILQQEQADPDEFPYILVIIDELSDLMLSSYDDLIEDKIVALAQKGRSANISLIIGTQNPITKVCTSNIKANCPTRIALKTISYVNSNVILDNPELNASKLDGKGDAIIRVASDSTEQNFRALYIEEQKLKDYANNINKKENKNGKS